MSKIGIFDSGVGGFSVLEKIIEKTTSDIVYYGDTIHAPYGIKNDEEIVELIKKDISFLKEKGVTHFINACNSMSVLTTQELLDEFSLEENYIDMVSAFTNHSDFCNGEKILIIGTEATVRNRAYEEVLKSKGVESWSLPLRNLASHIEQNISKELLIEEIKPSFQKAKEVGATHILYACTHYPLIDEVFLEVQEEMSWGGEFINPAQFVVTALREWNLHGEKQLEFYCSKDTEVFSEYSKKIAKERLELEEGRVYEI